eukprot:TRINITY_DN7614_c0_g1_i1.p1 TRINITY_DN7614_c0_g1~~TRINITY_DN7614_c0_g1_i1.p1  ORF type:complete len:510 (+),score=63.96 TRINITY_DN7614_c0_g1_i1:40-1569(+)
MNSPNQPPYNLQGFLWKKGALVLAKTWKRRWFFLSNNRLYYALDKEQEEAINYILLIPGTVVVPDSQTSYNGKGKLSFEIRCSYTHRIYHLEAESAEDYSYWVENLIRVVELISANRKTSIPPTPIPNQIVISKNYPVIDLLLLEAKSDAFEGELFCAVYCGSQKFKTWTSKKTLNRLVWNMPCTFSETEDILFRIFHKTGGIDVKLVEEKLQLSQLPNNEVLDIILPFDTKSTKHKGSLHVILHKTRAYSPTALLSQRGIPNPYLPVRLDTGDIILFNNTHALSYGTKLFTWSQWDHVAMVVRNQKNRLKLLEATADGVCYFSFDRRMSFLFTKAKIAVRFLQVKRTPRMQQKLWEFVAQVRGRPFKQDLLQMVKAAEGIRNKEDLSSLFCSQLVAAAYQSYGVLSCEKPSNQYVPKDWASRKNASLKFVMDATLHRKIIFCVRRDERQQKIAEVSEGTTSSEVVWTPTDPPQNIYSAIPLINTRPSIEVPRILQNRLRSERRSHQTL